MPWLGIGLEANDYPIHDVCPEIRHVEVAMLETTSRHKEGLP